MANQEEDIADEAFSADSQDPTPRADGKPGPPDDWPHDSWFDRQLIDWYWKGKLDPCPVRPLGYIEGGNVFVTALREIRVFSAGQLTGRGGLIDLFGGSMWWPLRHFRKLDEDGKPTGGLQERRCVQDLVKACGLAGYYDGSTPYRGIGTWRGPGRVPIVHAGDRIFHNSRIESPGVKIGEALYVIGGSRQAPRHTKPEHQPRTFDWDPCGPEVGRWVAAALDEWHWEDPEARDLYHGGLFCDMLGEAPVWRPHKFVRAPYSSGKSQLLKFSRALLGGAAHPIQRTYSRAFLEQHFSGTAAALLLDESESDEEEDRVRKLFELVRLLSDDEGATGGRGTSAGKARRFDVHGTVTMAATVSETWRPQDRSRIVLLELRPLNARFNQPPAPPESILALIEKAAEESAGLRARAIGRWDLFLENVKIARTAIMAMGGNTRDGDQLGHLIAGWWTMTSDSPLNEEDVEQLSRFRPHIMSLVEAEDGDDEASDCLNTLFGLTPHNKWSGGEQLTIGQIIAKAREEDGTDWRRALGPNGLRLDRKEGELWKQGWLLIANNHPGLDRLFVDHRQWRGKKRSQVLADLRRPVPGGAPLEAKKSSGHLRFAGMQSRYLLIPPGLLPSKEDEVQ